MTNLRGGEVMHLSPEALAGYLDDDLSPEEQRHVELHLAECAQCRAEFASLRRLERPRHGRRWMAIGAPAAAAAVLLLAIAIPRPHKTSSDVRSGPSDDGKIAIVGPAAFSEISTRRVAFVWRSAGAGASYTITLQSASGAIVWTSTAADTIAVLPDSITLAPRSSWHWSVEALLPTGRTVSSGLQQLRTPP